MTCLIDWIPIADLGMSPDEIRLFMIGQKLETGPLSEIWLGTNAFDTSQKFALQLRPSKPGKKSRQARLISESLGDDDERIPREISQDQVADAAGFLGFEWFNYLPLGAGQVLFSQEPPPIEGVEVFPGRKR